MTSPQSTQTPPLSHVDDEIQLTLRDGSRVVVRPIRHEDRARLEQGLQLLSPRSRYLRFHTHVERLTSAQLDYLVDIDHHDHEALVALDAADPDLAGVGVARYIRLTDEPEVAEAAVTVIDSWQGRGLGTALIGLLEPLAKHRGIHTLRNYVLAENRAMLEIFEDLGGHAEQESPGVYRVDVPLPEHVDELPDSPAGQWIREVGRIEPEERDTWAFPLGWWVDRLLDVVSGPVRVLRMLTGEEDFPWEEPDGDEGPEERSPARDERPADGDDPVS